MIDQPSICLSCADSSASSPVSPSSTLTILSATIASGFGVPQIILSNRIPTSGKLSDGCGTPPPHWIKDGIKPPTGSAPSYLIVSR